VPARKPSVVIDGFTTVAAVRHARQAGREYRADAERAEKERAEREAARDRAERRRQGARIDHTVLPERHDIVCYDCGYTFVLNGRIRDTYCPKCRELLAASEHVIEGDWSEDILSIGRLEVQAHGVLHDCEVVVRECVLAGDVRKARLRVCGRLELCDGARFNPERIQACDIVVRPGGTFTTSRKLRCRNLDVSGVIKARVAAEGVITVHPGGCLQGDIRGDHLVVEAGGGLKAELHIGKER
jgi:predicted Zn-ribbon and HTH transcriptional regulator